MIKCIQMKHEIMNKINTFMTISIENFNNIPTHLGYLTSFLDSILLFHSEQRNVKIQQRTNRCLISNNV